MQHRQSLLLIEVDHPELNVDFPFPVICGHGPAVHGLLIYTIQD